MAGIIRGFCNSFANVGNTIVYTAGAGLLALKISAKLWAGAATLNLEQGKIHNLSREEIRKDEKNCYKCIKRAGSAAKRVFSGKPNPRSFSTNFFAAGGAFINNKIMDDELKAVEDVREQGRDMKKEAEKGNKGKKTSKPSSDPAIIREREITPYKITYRKEQYLPKEMTLVLDNSKKEALITAKIIRIIQDDKGNHKSTETIIINIPITQEKARDLLQRQEFLESGIPVGRIPIDAKGHEGPTDLVYVDVGSAQREENTASGPNSTNSSPPASLDPGSKGDQMPSIPSEFDIFYQNTINNMTFSGTGQ